MWATADFVPRFELLPPPPPLPPLPHPPSPQGGGYVAHLPLWGHLLVLSPTVKRMGPPLPTRDMWAICRSSAPVLVLSSVGDPQDGQVYKANLPTCRPLQVLFPSLEAPPPWHGLCRQYVHLWVSLEFIPHCEAWVPPEGKVRVAPCLFVCHFYFSPLVWRCWGAPDGSGYVANAPSCGPSVVLFHALRRWRLPRWQGARHSENARKARGNDLAAAASAGLGDKEANFVKE